MLKAPAALKRDPLLFSTLGFLVVVLLWGEPIVGFASYPEDIFPRLTPARFFEPDPQILEKAQEIGISRENIRQSKAHFGKNCGTVDPGGCFRNKTVVIERKSFEKKEDARSILAHEYLHWVWEKRTSQEDRNSLLKDLQSVYEKNGGYLRRRLVSSPYANASDELFVSELHSYIGAEFSDKDLPPRLSSWYRGWISNRHLLPAAVLQDSDAIREN